MYIDVEVKICLFKKKLQRRFILEENELIYPTSNNMSDSHQYFLILKRLQETKPVRFII